MKKRIRAIPGGTSASKTFSIILILIDLALTDKEITLTSIVSESFPHLKRGAMRDFLTAIKGLNIFKANNWNKTDSIYTFETGSQIEFFSVDQADKVRGARRDRLFINEANNVTFEAFEQLEVRTKEFIFLDWNPSSEFWYYTELKGKRNDIEELTLTYKDNEALSPEIIASIEQRKNRSSWWKVYGLGQLGEIEGRIYTGWQIIDTIPHEARLEQYGLDFGYHPDPACIVAVYYYNGGWILDEVVYKRGMQNTDLVNTFKSIEDKLVIADSAEPKSIAEISSYGINIQPTVKGKDSKKFGIKSLQAQPISITKRSINGIKEYRNYLFKTDKDGNIIPGEAEDGNDHFLDAARYGLSTLGQIKKELSYWDRVFQDELSGNKTVKRVYNRGL